MSTQIGRRHIVGITVGAFTVAGLSGTISYDERSLRVVHQGEITKVKNEAGETIGLIATNEGIEATFTMIPYGTNKTNAIASLAAPPLLAGVTITGMDVVPIGSFADGLNVTGGGNAQPWIYEGGWEISGTGDGEPWTITVTLRRYPLVTSATAIA